MRMQAFIFLLLACWAGAPAYGQHIRSLDELRELRQALGLKEDQTAKLSALIGAAARGMIRNQAEIEITQMDLKELAEAKTPDLKQVDAKIDELTTLQAKQLKMEIRLWIDQRGILDADQQTQLNKVRSNQKLRAELLRRPDAPLEEHRMKAGPDGPSPRQQYNTMPPVLMQPDARRRTGPQRDIRHPDRAPRDDGPASDVPRQRDAPRDDAPPRD